jgi:hypothetical protein
MGVGFAIVGKTPLKHASECQLVLLRNSDLMANRRSAVCTAEHFSIKDMKSEAEVKMPLESREKDSRSMNRLECLGRKKKRKMKATKNLA